MAKRERWNPLKTGYIDSKKVNKCSFEAETLFTRLIAACDDNSNFDGDAHLLACKLYAEKIKHGSITFEQVERMRAELVTNLLLIPYQINGENYVHIPNNRKFLRSDIKPDIRFPNIPQAVLDKWFTEHVTETERNCNEIVSSQTNTKTKTNPKTNSTTETDTNQIPACEIIEDPENNSKDEPKDFDNNSSNNPLVLGLKFWELLEKNFQPLTESQETTFKRLSQFLATHKIEYSKVIDALNDARSGNNKPALFVKLCKDRFGFSGNGKILHKEAK